MKTKKQLKMKRIVLKMIKNMRSQQREIRIYQKK